MNENFYFWASIALLAINLILTFISVGLFVANRKEKERRNSQVKIWMQTSNGITQALLRIVNDKWAGLYSQVQDVVNTVFAIHASSFSLYQSLYEERTMTEKEYKQEQSEIKNMIKNNNKQQESASATTKLVGKKTPAKNVKSKRSR